MGFFGGEAVEVVLDSLGSAFGPVSGHVGTMLRSSWLFSRDGSYFDDSFAFSSCFMLVGWEKTGCFRELKRDLDDSFAF